MSNYKLLPNILVEAPLHYFNTVNPFSNLEKILFFFVSKTLNFYTNSIKTTTYDML